MNKKFIQIAHRGHSDFFKDNTINAFIDAYKNNFDMIELDIVLTKDNKIAIYHDTFINELLIKNITYEELRNIDKDIILLETFFKLIDTNKIKVYLDIKGDHNITIFLHELLENNKNNIINLNNVYLASFNTIILKELIELNPNYQLGFITENVFENDILMIYKEKYNLKFIAFHWTSLNNYNIDFLHKNNILIYTYTCKNNNILLFMKEFNIDGIVTNYKI
jgi:glycerophosphoryl diester phosphodiesterase